MKTPYLDKEIARLNAIGDDLSEYGLKLLNEYREIKEALGKADGVGQSQQLRCPECELDYDREEIEMFRGLCESCRDREF